MKETSLDVSKELEDFEKHWDEMCKKFETTELSKNDAEGWNNKFELDKLKLKLKIPDYCCDFDIEQRLARVKHKVDVAILNGQKNFHKSEIISAGTKSKSNIKNVIKGFIKGIPWLGPGIDALVEFLEKDKD